MTPIGPTIFADQRKNTGVHWRRDFFLALLRSKTRPGRQVLGDCSDEYDAPANVSFKSLSHLVTGLAACQSGLERAQARFNACSPALATPKPALFLSRSRLRLNGHRANFVIALSLGVYEMQFRDLAILPHFSRGTSAPRFIKPGLKSTHQDPLVGDCLCVGALPPDLDETLP